MYVLVLTVTGLNREVKLTVADILHVLTLYIVRPFSQRAQFNDFNSMKDLHIKTYESKH